MHVLALLVEIAAVVTPIAGILVELGRHIPDDDDRGRPLLGAGAFRPPSMAG